MIQARLDVTIEERNKAWKQEQELLAEGQTLEAQHNELKVQLATTKDELESRLRVADIELESKQRQYEREHEFAQGQNTEVERLKSKLKEVWDEFKTEKAKLADLQAQIPPVQTVAQ